MSDTPAPRATAGQAASAASPGGPGDRLVRAGGIVFLVGAVATAATIAPLFTGADPLPPAAYGVCMLMGVGFLVAMAGVLRSIGSQRRRAAPARR